MQMLPPGECVDLTVLEAGADCVPAAIESHRDHRMTLRLDRALPQGSAVKVEWHNSLFLAEVVGCKFEDGHFAASLEVEHALFDTAELAALARQVLEGRL